MTAPAGWASRSVARYRIDWRGHRLHEISRFVREDGRWCYLSGELIAKDKPAR